jgi:hypothetical protein
MTFDQWLDEETGRPANLARHFGVSWQAVHQWRTKGVPRDKLLEINRLSGERVSLREMLEATPQAGHAEPAPSIVESRP